MRPVRILDPARYFWTISNGEMLKREWELRQPFCSHLLYCAVPKHADMRRDGADVIAA